MSDSDFISKREHASDKTHRMGMDIPLHAAEPLPSKSGSSFVGSPGTHPAAGDHSHSSLMDVTDGVPEFQEPIEIGTFYYDLSTGLNVYTESGWVVVGGGGGGYKYSIRKVYTSGWSVTQIFNMNSGVAPILWYDDGVSEAGIEVLAIGVYLISCQYADGSGPAPWHGPATSAIGTDEITLEPGQKALVDTSSPVYLTADWRAPYIPPAC